MTTTDTPKMKPEQQRIKIAEACGWKPDKRGLGWLCPHGYYAPEPDYLNDLNAMHEAECWMMANKSLMTFWEYAGRLKKHFQNLGDDGYIHATASQRAEAFLRTLGKWEDGK